jgi:hypothetical protein
MAKIIIQQDETFNKLKVKMSKAQNVHHWNDLRNEAKLLYPMETINKLDASGYISEVLK